MVQKALFLNMPVKEDDSAIELSTVTATRALTTGQSVCDDPIRADLTGRRRQVT